MRVSALFWGVVLLLSPLFGMRLHYSALRVSDGRCLLLTARPDHKERPAYAAFEGVRYPFYRDPIDPKKGYYALLPVAYGTRPHRARVTAVSYLEGHKHYASAWVRIVSGRYPKERLRVDPSKTRLSMHDRKRVEREYREAMRIYRTETPEPLFHERFVLPLHSRITSPFGTARLFNKTLKSYHSGCDFRAKRGTPIKAAAAGRVVLVRNRFFAGNSVVIDHGEGIYTGYYHLSRFAVRSGERIERGEVLGYAGSTGRVTGPHLHFSARVHGVQVDPVQLVRLLSRL